MQQKVSRGKLPGSKRFGLMMIHHYCPTGGGFGLVTGDGTAGASKLVTANTMTLGNEIIQGYKEY